MLFSDITIVEHEDEEVLEGEDGGQIPTRVTEYQVKHFL